MKKPFDTVPYSLIFMVLLDAVGLVLIEANNAGLELIIYASAYLFCIAGFYVVYQVLVNARGW